MRPRYILLWWAAIMAGGLGLSLYADYLALRYGPVRVLSDMTDIMIGVISAGVVYFTVWGVILLIRKYRK